MTTSPVPVAVLVLASYLAYSYINGKKDRHALPPGPPGLPVVGNALDMPTENEWLTYSDWGQKYGPICSVAALGQNVIVVNSVDIMDEMDRKGAIYSDRPRLEMGGELVGYNETLVLIPYSDRWRTYRKHIARTIGGTASIDNLQVMISGKVRQFLRHLVTSPHNLIGHLRKLTGGIILQLTYGIDVRDEGNDPFVDLIEKANGNFNAATVPGAFIVDFFPFLKCLPEWLPGMGFLKTARLWRQDTISMVEVPYKYTEEQIAAGKIPPSFVSKALESKERLTPDQIRDIKYTASSLYGGGADTTVSAEYAFFLAMVLNPDVQKKAQAELDAVIGSDRLPNLADRDNLPYVHAIVLEVLRWNTVTPIGVPHRAIEDSVLHGYSVPKGSVIMTNLWNILHDQELYPDPFRFNPERYIAVDGEPVQRDPRTICFGYGRRVCPGMHLADGSLFLTLASSLLFFDITKTVEDGVEITPIYEQSSGIITYPKPFKCSIKPRTSASLSLLSDE
ncbi:hypothetical protein APHAL10511_000685 [Amanita phalloides]|nr:hypothetical protein APHAL10511_000685 [Amanita phalloides]